VVDLQLGKIFRKIMDGPFKKSPGIVAGNMMQQKAYPLNKFIAQGLSRLAFAAAHKGFIDHTAYPKFDAPGFVKNNTDIALTVNDHTVLANRVWDAVSTFIWPADYFGLGVVAPNNSKITIINSAYAKPHPLLEAGIDKPDGFVDLAIKNKWLLYVPDARFDHLHVTSRYFYHMDVKGDLTGKEIVREPIKDEDFKKLVKFLEAYHKAQSKKEPFPQSLVIAPIFMPNKETIGYYIVGYAELAKLGCEEHQVQEGVVFDITLKYYQTIAEAAARAMSVMPIIHTIGKN
jgi:hypothetical protein